MPESASLQLKLTVTLVLFQPAAFGAGVTLPVIVGAVRSILMLLTVTLALLPATSLTVPLADWLAPSLLSTCAAGQAVARPLPLSAQLKLTVTALLFQPLALAAGVRLPLMVGGVWSTLRVRLWLPSTLPATSTDQYATVQVPSLNGIAAEYAWVAPLLMA